MEVLADKRRCIKVSDFGFWWTGIHVHHLNSLNSTAKKFNSTNLANILTTCSLSLHAPCHEPNPFSPHLHHGMVQIAGLKVLSVRGRKPGHQQIFQIHSVTKMKNWKSCGNAVRIQCYFPFWCCLTLCAQDILDSFKIILGRIDHTPCLIAHFNPSPSPDFLHPEFCTWKFQSRTRFHQDSQHLGGDGWFPKILVHFCLGDWLWTLVIICWFTSLLRMPCQLCVYVCLEGLLFRICFNDMSFCDDVGIRIRVMNC